MLKKLAALLTLGMLVAFMTLPMASAPMVIKTDWDSDDHPSLTSDITEAVNRVAMEHPEVRGVTVTTLPIMLGAYAYAGNRRIVFNDLYMSSAILVEYMVHNDVEQGFHPPLGECSPASFLAYHESAHIIDQARDRAASRMVKERFTGTFGLSGYSYVDGVLNPGEALAEAFAAVQCNGGNPVEQEIAALLN